MPHDAIYDTQPQFQTLSYIVESVNFADRKNCINRMVEDADVHFMRYVLNPGDTVLIKKNFDANPKTKKEKPGDFYESDT